MKILKLSPYFYPEQVSSSHLTEDLNEAYAKAGFNQENIVPTPSRGISDNVRKEYSKKKEEVLQDGRMIVHRFRMFKEGKNPIIRAIRYILVNIIQYQRGKKVFGVDVIFGASTPPTQGMLCAKIKKQLSKKYGYNVPFVYNLQDVFPDSLVNAKMTKKGSIIWKVGRKIEDYTYKNADVIITISEDFKDNIILKGVPEEKIKIVPNWVNTDNIYPVERKDNLLFDRYNLDKSLFYICYSGNIGHSQNMDLLLDVAKLIDISDVRFVLIGEGAAKSEVQTRIANEKISNVILLPFQDYSEIAHVFSFGDIGLIISKPNVGQSSVPSKSFGIMAAERPILASFDEKSELCRLIKRANCGVIAESNSKESLLNGIKILYENKELREEFGICGRKYVSSYMNKEICVNEYVKTIQEVCKHEKSDDGYLKK